MPKFPYKQMGVRIDSEFRNNLNQSLKDIESDIIELNGAQLQALEAANEAETQAIYAGDRGDYADEKGLYASNQGDYAKNQGDYSKAQGDHAKTQGDYVETKRPLIDKFTGDQTNLQSQIDQLVVAGDSSPEAAQARVDASGKSFTTLRERLNNTDAQLAETERKLVGVLDIDIRDFGAKTEDEDSNFDNANALKSAIELANSLNGNVKISFPKGKMKFGAITTDFPAITKGNIWFVGQGDGITTLKLTSGTYFKFGNGGTLFSSGGISDLQISYDVADELNPTILISNASSQNYRNVYFYNVCTLIQCGVDDGTNDFKAYAQRFTNCRLNVANVGKPAIKLVNGAGFYWEGGTGGSVLGVPHAVHPNSMTTVEGTNFINVYSWDTVRLSTFIERFYDGINVVANAGKACLNIFLNNCIFDYIRNKCGDFNANGGIINTVVVTGGRYMSWENHSFHFRSVSTFREIHLKNFLLGTSGGSGIQFEGNTSRFYVDDVTVHGTGRVAEISSNSIVIAGGVSDFRITNSICGGDTTDSGTTWGFEKGISLNGTNDNYIINNCKSAFYSISTATQSSANASKKRSVKGNVFIGSTATNNYAGYKSSAYYNLPATATDWYNTTPYELEMTLYGGTFTQVTKESVILSAGQPVTFTLQPGEKYAVTYSVAPTLRVFAKQ